MSKMSLGSKGSTPLGAVQCCTILSFLPFEWTIMKPWRLTIFLVKFDLRSCNWKDRESLHVQRTIFYDEDPEIKSGRSQKYHSRSLKSNSDLKISTLRKNLLKNNLAKNPQLAWIWGKVEIFENFEIKFVVNHAQPW